MDQKNKRLPFMMNEIRENIEYIQGIVGDLHEEIQKDPPDFSRIEEMAGNAKMYHAVMRGIREMRKRRI